MSALFVKKCAILSKPFISVESKPLQTDEQKKNPLFYMEFFIQKGKVSEALGAVDYLIETQSMNSMGQETLSFLASKNLYSVLYAHDMKLASQLCVHFLDRNCHNSYSPSGILLFSLLLLLIGSVKNYISSPSNFPAKIKFGV